MNTKTKTILALVSMAIVLIGASFAYKNLSKNYTPEQNLSLQGKNDAVSPNPNEGTSQDNQQDTSPAPDFAVLDAEGNERMLSDYFGKPIVLNFWASWCPPCKSEMPDFQKLYLEQGTEVQFLMVDMVDGQRETMEKGKQYIEDKSYTFPVLFDTKQNAANTYGVSSIPTSIFIDKDGNIVGEVQGAIKEETLRKGISLIVTDKQS